MLHLRKRKPYVSYQALADVLKVSKKSVSEWATGRVDPEAESLVRLADFLNVSVDYLLGRVDEPTAIVPDISPRLRRILDSLAEFDEPEIEAILRAFQSLKHSRPRDERL